MSRARTCPVDYGSESAPVHLDRFGRKGQKQNGKGLRVRDQRRLQLLQLFGAAQAQPEYMIPAAACEDMVRLWRFKKCS